MMEDRLAPIQDVDQISFPGEEEKVLQLWKDINVFQNCLKQSKDKPRFTFYDGPPFATGLPHYGHILAGTIKDVVTRYAHQTGHHVERRFGWDTHGLPVEYEIDKTHNIRGPKDVEALGIDKYNKLCREIVMRYASDWERIITRFGRWIDFRNDYKTLYPWYMESIWWIFSQLYEKGLVYRGVKVMPFSTACSTPLSNFEAGQNYKDTQDPSVVVLFPVMNTKSSIGDEEAALVAWTTTPWTLPSNLALCVNPDLDYVKVRGKTEERKGVYILMEARLQQLFKNPSEDCEVLARYKGKQLEGTQYVSLFNYFEEYGSRGAFRVLCDGYVSAESGTGIVHQAPYFGEDDFRVCLRYGIITKDQRPLCPVDEAGCFTDEVQHFQGLHVKEADPEIIKHLRSVGRLVSSERVNHSYPFCWRSDTPLIYRAVPSWFVRVQHMQDKLLEANAQTYWVPNFIKEKRFANWLRDARDWAISRNRYWGTPIPLWTSQDMEEVVCVSSIAELERLSGEKVTDIHRDSIDHITIPSKRPGHPPLRRISEVFDCWFESGSMPYAQVHYPFENKTQFEECFPADFIAEGIDQTRGWFYTLLVISTALYGRPPFKNLIVNGLVLAADGQKMSKRKKNYPDPVEVVDRYGADALRLYLTNSPAVRGENLRFKEEEVKALLKEVFIPWLNAYRYFGQQVERLEKDEGIVFQYEESNLLPRNVMDRWILSFTQSLLAFVRKEMKAYRLYTVTPRLVKFVDNLTNWYVRFNRKRLKGDLGTSECQDSLATLYNVLLTMVRVMSPFTPFITETMYQNLKRVLRRDSELRGDSVHYLMVPEPQLAMISERTEAAVATLQSVVELGRYLRDKLNCPIKYPLPEVVVIQKEERVLKDVLELESYIKEELNVRTVTTSTDKGKYGVALKAEINFKLLGARLKEDVKQVQQAVAALKDDEITSALSSGTLDVLGHTISAEELVIKYAFSGDKAEELSSKYQAHSDASVLILLDTTPSQEMLWEGLAREVVNRVQKLKKKGRLVPTDEVTVWYSVTDSTGELQQVIDCHLDYIQTATRAPLRPLDARPLGCQLVIEDDSPKKKIKEATLELVITKGFVGGFSTGSSNAAAGSSRSSAGVSLACPWVNVVYEGTSRRGTPSAVAGTLLLENPSGSPTLLTAAQLVAEARCLYGFPKDSVEAVVDGSPLTGVTALAGKTVHIVPRGRAAVPRPSNGPAASYMNLSLKNGRVASVLLENPAGSGVSSPYDILSVTAKLTGSTPTSVCLYGDEQRTKRVRVESNEDVGALAGKTCYC
ncbi:Isoleucine-tRNA ligase type 2 [Trinorchestia longiramus]|nr:Isoleucine-tRNA ligase type 2 [Trinorchestia longiramus]